jgi:hypothetical protein
MEASLDPFEQSLSQLTIVRRSLSEQLQLSRRAVMARLR